VRRIDLGGKLVVVTGASSGLGREIARSLALQEHADLVIAARRSDRLLELKTDIEARCASHVHVLPVDLAEPEGALALFNGALAVGDVFALVNCAGITFYGRTLEASIEMCERIVTVNLVSEMKATLLFLRHFLERGAGAILTVTSMSAFVPAPFQNVYAATKHGMQAFMEGLAREYRGSGITFSTFVPGGMATEMNTLAGLDKKFKMDSPVNMDPKKAARLAVASFTRGKLRAVPGLMYRTVIFLLRLVPSSMVSWIMGRLYAPPS